MLLTTNERNGVLRSSWPREIDDLVLISYYAIVLNLRSGFYQEQLIDAEAVVSETAAVGEVVDEQERIGLFGKTRSVNTSSGFLD